MAEAGPGWEDTDATVASLRVERCRMVRVGLPAEYDRARRSFGGNCILSTMDRAGTASLPQEADTATMRPAVRAAHLLTYDFLAWVAGRPRTYAEVMATWQTHCPRLSIWEDALDNGLVTSARSEQAAGQVLVTLTPCGQAMLDSRR